MDRITRRRRLPMGRTPKIVAVLSATVLLLLLAGAPKADAVQGAPHWEEWEPAVFQQARAQHRFVVLQMVESWCVECTAEDRRTFGDAKVQQLVADRYLTARVALSARPDVAARYAGYELPSTIIFNTDGSEILRLQGPRSAEQMAAILQAVIDDPSPGPSVKPDPEPSFPDSPSLAPDEASALEDAFWTQYEIADQLSSFGTKYLDRDSFEYAMLLAMQGNTRAQARIDDFLRTGLLLRDRAGGGVHQSLVVAQPQQGAAEPYQFGRMQIGGHIDVSGAAWNDAHLEEPLSTQAQALWIFATAYRQWKRPEYLAAATSISEYVRHSLTSSDGTFFAGQFQPVLDPRGKRQGQGDGTALSKAPAVDANVYTDVNADMVSALCALYRITRSKDDLAAAEKPARWMVKHRLLANHLYGHGGSAAASMPGEAYLGDTVVVGQSFLDLYLVTGNREWLARAQEAAAAVPTLLSGPAGPGYLVAAQSSSPSTLTKVDRVVNARFVRFAAQLLQCADLAPGRELAAPAMRYLAAKEIATDGLPAATLLAQRWLSNPPQCERLVAP